MSAVAAVVVNYDSEGHLVRCLECLGAQDEVEEVVVVDNGPQGRGVRDLVLARHPSVTLVCNRRNVGFARACNQGFRLTSAPWLLLLNPDCELRAGAVSQLIRCAEAHRKAAAVGPRLLNSDGTLQTSAYTLPSLPQILVHLIGLKSLVPTQLVRKALGRSLGRLFGQFDPHNRETRVEMVTGACALVRRRALLEVGLFDPGFFLYNEEKDWCYRAQQSGWEIWFTPTAEAVHHIGGSGPPGSSHAFRHRSLGTVRFYRKHRTLMALAVVQVMVAAAAAGRALSSADEETARYHWQTARLALSLPS